MVNDSKLEIGNVVYVVNSPLSCKPVIPHHLSVKSYLDVVLMDTPLLYSPVAYSITYTPIYVLYMECLHMRFKM